MARLLDFILGHQEIITKLVSSFEQGKPGQTYLFVGPSGIGKKMTAMGLAQALMCPQSRRGCGKCPSCFRVAQGTHEGLKIVSPSGTNIKMEQAKEVLDFLSLRSLSGNRVIIIDQAQSLNPQAANALLKTLEEPPEGTFFFLISPSVAGLLPTIRSRSRVVQFKPLKAEDLSKKSKAPAWALNAAGGSFEKLAQLQEGPEQEVRQKAIELLTVFLNDQDFLLSELWRSEFKDRAQGARIVSYWAGFMKDAVYLQEGQKTQIVNLDQPSLIKTLAENSREFLLNLIQKTLQVEQSLLAHRDAQLVMEEFYITSRPQ
ncbi:DNA polymerase III subunit delta' [Bdellovibrio bacteriovorus]|uniref:DNA polymerase III subunit delta' n=1 Tax=Bdellovibrio bacteriovorus TaxID=959 RepID=A0A150WF33_BDEBC|nr:DNA polymerase III subunit delta' [Bdellovibrio bacteriovorus]KYG61515.1 DNA polymerase III subunit delta' [Bdellovibrio bacteriovorus]